jgi:iron complex outermembrane recepter protein
MAIRGAQEMRRLRPALPTVFACLTSFSFIASAQEQAPNTESTSLQEVVITATKRTTTVQTTPISITAVTGAEIASRGLTDLDSLVTTVPGVAVRASGNPGDNEFEIRGLNSQGGNTSMVGLYLGEIPLSAPATSEFGKIFIDPATYDLDRVEVLRGPQGTLYGSSSMGGTIRLIPNAPQLSTYEASTQEVLSYTTSGGGINHQENGMLNIPVGDTAAVRIVGSFTADSGWIKRLVIHDGAVAVDSGVYPDVSRPSNFYTAPIQQSFSGVNTSNVDQIRAELLWKPISNLTVDSMVMYENTLSGGPDAVDVNGQPTHPEVPAVWAHYEIYDAPEPQSDTIGFGSLNIVYELPSLSLTSATGFWHRNSIHQEDSTEEIASAIGIPAYSAAAGGVGPNASPFGAGMANQDYTRQLTEEFRLASTTPISLTPIPGHLDWLLGYFYQDLYSETDQLLFAPEATPALGGTALFYNLQPQDIVQNAVFGHLSWEITPRWKIEAGFRHYDYSLSQTNSQWGYFGVIAVPPYTERYNTAASIAAGGTIPSFTLTYSLNDNDMIYANVAEGFRLGGASQPVPVLANTPANVAINAEEVSNECAVQAKELLTATCNPNVLLQAPSTFKSDTLWSYELGEKFAFFDRRMTVDFSAYYEQWLHPQIETALSGFNISVTGSDAAIVGADLQVDALLPWGFDIHLAGGYTHAQFLYNSDLTGYPAGYDVPDTPKVTASGVLNWRHGLSDRLSLFGSIETNYVGDRSEVPLIVTATLLNINQVLMTLPAYCLTNLRFGLKGNRNNGDTWTATLFVNNVANKAALLDPQPQLALQTEAYTRFTITQPLTAGVDVTYHF